MSLKEAMDDCAECERLERELLTPAQRQILDPKNPPRWDLNPPMREEYDSPRAYVLGLGRYADRVMAAKGWCAMIAIAAPATQPKHARMSSTMRRALRILLAAGRPVRTRGLARVAAPHEFAAIAPGDVNALRQAFGRVAQHFGRLKAMGLTERVTVVSADAVTHPWRLTAAGMEKALEMQPWVLDTEALAAAERAALG